MKPALTNLQDDALPQLQSVVMVLMKAVLYNVTASISLPQNRGADGLPISARMSQGGPGMFRNQDGSAGANGSAPSEAPDMSTEDLDQARAREIEGKALTGIILLLLKWFKVSR